LIIPRKGIMIICDTRNRMNQYTNVSIPPVTSLFFTAVQVIKVIVSIAIISVTAKYNNIIDVAL
jgi:hypothetical protein